MRTALTLVTLLASATALPNDDCAAQVGKTFVAGSGSPTLAFAEKRTDGIYLNQSIPSGQKFQVIDLTLGHNADDDFTVITQDGRRLNIMCEPFLAARSKYPVGQQVLPSAPEDFSEVKTELKAKDDAAAAKAAEDAAQWKARQEAAVAEIHRQREAEARAHKASLAREAKMERERMARGGVRIGMTEQQVLTSSWGEPDKRNHNFTPKGDIQQWVYADQYFLYFVNGILTGVQTDSPDAGYFRVAH
jgi:hypothetical protein